MREKFFYLIYLLTSCWKFNGLWATLQLKVAIIKSLFFSSILLKQRKCKLFGLTFYFDDIDALKHLLYEDFGKNVYFFKSKKKQPVIVDVGTNIGDSLLYFKYLYPNSKIYAFEPIPHLFEQAKINIKKNHIKGIEIFNQGLSNFNGIVDIYKDTSATCLVASTNKSFSDRYVREKGGGLMTEKISVKKISEKLTELNIDEIDLLKIDIEGGESKLLMDLGGFVTKIKNIVIEYHLVDNQTTNSLDDIIVFFNNNGFKIFVFGDYRGSANMTDPNCFYIMAKKI